MAEDDEMLVPEDEALVLEEPVEDEIQEEGFLDKLRGATVGSEDPNIVGDAGPTDIPPGTDGPNDGLLVTTDEPVDHLEV